VKKALQLAKDIEIPAKVLAKESAVEAAQLGLELRENLPQMIKVNGVLKTAEDAQEKVVCLEAVASEAPEGNSDSYTAAANEIIIVESRTSFETRTISASLSSSSSTSSDPDDIPLSKVYTTLNKALSPSPSTKTSKKPDYDTFVPMYPFVDACIHLPVDHPLQPPMIEPIQSIPIDAEGADDHTGTYIANIDVSSSKPNSPIQTTQTSTKTSEPSII